MTPYLVPGYELLQALLYASRRGVDVKLLLPHIPDKKYAFALAHTYYAQLIEAGIRIYEYTPGFVHSKVFVSDDRIAVVGAINLDYRSLYLNYECAVMLYEVEEIQKIEDDFVMTLPKCRLITPFDIRHDRFLRVAAGKLSPNRRPPSCESPVKSHTGNETRDRADLSAKVGSFISGNGRDAHSATDRSREAESLQSRRVCGVYGGVVRREQPVQIYLQRSGVSFPGMGGTPIQPQTGAERRRVCKADGSVACMAEW